MERPLRSLPTGTRIQCPSPMRTTASASRSPEAEAPSVMWRVLVVLGGISVALLGACGDDDGESANADDSAPPTTDEPTTTSTKSGGPPACIDGARPLDIGGGGR